MRFRVCLSLLLAAPSAAQEDAAAACRSLLAYNNVQDRRWAQLNCDELMLRGRGSTAQMLVKSADDSMHVRSADGSSAGSTVCHELLEARGHGALVELEASDEWRDNDCARRMLEGAERGARSETGEEGAIEVT